MAQKTHLITGAAGFVGRNMLKRLYTTTEDRLVCVDDLSVGQHPSSWLNVPEIASGPGWSMHGPDARILFLYNDVREVLREIGTGPGVWSPVGDFPVHRIADVFHFAAIVGGRSKIDGDPMAVALDLSIDAELMHWACKYKPERLLYPSSSAAYPIDLQTEQKNIALAESDIDFTRMGQPDMTYGWSKLTGEYLAQVAAEYYQLKVTCIRPFSGYGEDQDLSYPIPALAIRAARHENPFEVWGTGYQGRDFVHIDDVLDCILLAMDHIHDGSAINIGTGKLNTFREIIDIFCGFAEYRPEIKALTDKPVGVYSRYSNMDFVKSRLGWEAKISLEEGLRKVYEAALVQAGVSP